MKSKNEFININTENISTLKEQNDINDLNKLTELKGIISGYKDFKTLQIEKVLNENQIPTKKPSLKKIFENKNILFNKEFTNLNGLYSSINCYIKKNNKYDFGKLVVNGKRIIVYSNKKAIKQRVWSFSEISTTNAKNNSSQNQLPNYIMNDTIDKILTGRNALIENNKEMPIYLLNINLDLITCKLIIHKEKQKFRLLLLGSKYKDSNDSLNNIKKIKFNCTNAENSNFCHVCEIINKCIILSEGYKINKFGVNFNNNYYSEQYMNLMNFVKEANTCDILLLKSYSTSSKCQRCITRGGYDHIILLVKSDNNLFLFDCIEEDGVRIRKFTDLINTMIYLTYEKIVYRKLNINIDDMIDYVHINNIDKYENIDNYYKDNMSYNEIKKKFYNILNHKLKIFIKNNINSKYDFPVCTYICKSKKTKNKQIINRSTYFCSELVASVYMFCDIMSNEYDPMDYLPGAFSEKGKIEFINGFYLEPEMIIDFSE